ncbi:MAG: hypothetical protein JGK29_11840 [Microcoleus sp. PH2017_17_BER_D_A]|nr:hypothetical protein [Microcoleus sp. PH2017_17_BER_D_A]
MKAPSPGEIKIRLFITPILGLKRRGRCQLSTVNCQLNESPGIKNWLDAIFSGKLRLCTP